MSPRTLQILLGLLTTAVTVVLALVVLATFLRVLRPPDPERIAARAETATTTTTRQPANPGPTDTTTPPATATTVAPPPTEGVIPGGCQEPPPRNPQGTVVRVFYTCGSTPVPDVTGSVYRTVPATATVLTATLTEMVEGPDEAEREMGFTSVFSEASSGVFAGVVLDSGTAIVDFVGLEVLDGLDQPTVATAMVASLNATVFQFDTVDAVEYRLGGSCEAFGATMATGCVSTSRGEWEQQLAAWTAEG